MVWFLVSVSVRTWPLWGGDLAHEGIQLLRGAINANPVVRQLPVDTSVEWQYSAVADDDNDGLLELVIVSNKGTVYSYQLNQTSASVEWTASLDSIAYASPFVGDVDGDGDPEVVVGSANSRVSCLDARTGTLEWTYMYTDGYIVQAGPSVYDVNGDGVMEIFIGVNRVAVCLRGDNGRALWTLNLPGSINQPGALADIDGDGEIKFFPPQVMYQQVDTLYASGARELSVELWDASGRKLGTLFEGVLNSGTHYFPVQRGKGVVLAVAKPQWGRAVSVKVLSK